MDVLDAAKERLRVAVRKHEEDLRGAMAELDREEELLAERRAALDEKKRALARRNGAPDAAADDWIEVNAGGDVVAAKRSTLTLLGGTRLEALFSGRWDRSLQRDDEGRIFLDVNPVAFRAIVDYLNEAAISSEDDPPSPPSVAPEHRSILQHQLQMFGLPAVASVPDLDSNIIKSRRHVVQLHQWLEENDANGGLQLLYRSSTDDASTSNFHSKCDNRGSTITIVETLDGYIVGGYTSIPWKSKEQWHGDKKAFLFVLSGTDVHSPSKMKLKNQDEKRAVHHSASYGPTFGCLSPLTDFYVDGLTLRIGTGGSYERGPSVHLARGANNQYKQLEIKEMEVFRVSGTPPPTMHLSGQQHQSHSQHSQCEQICRFAQDVNEAITAKREALLHLKSEVAHLERNLTNEEDFVSAFANGDSNDVITLNVSGVTMTTKRASLRIVEDSVLAQQFDDSKWTKQECKSFRAKGWTHDEVIAWVRGLEGVPGYVVDLFKDNEITGKELLALGASTSRMKFLGVKGTGTVFLLWDEIKKLKGVTLIEHSPYCFGKILDHLRLKHLASLGLSEAPAVPQVCNSHLERFEKVVRYYFPGDSAKSILG